MISIVSNYTAANDNARESLKSIRHPKYWMVEQQQQQKKEPA
jgi:hypothetical protein